MDMGRRRTHRKDLPRRVYFDHGAYFFVPKVGPKIHLGRSLAEALAEYAKLVDVAQKPLTTLSAIMDRYLRDVLPTKAERTQKDYGKAIGLLRTVFGEMAPDDVIPADVYAFMDRRPPIAANREKAVLSSVFVAAIRWGAAKANPCRLVKRNPEKARTRYVEDAELEQFKAIAGDFLAAYVDLKYLTGLRKGDLLALRLDALTEAGIAVTPRKTAATTGARLLYEWTPELRAAVNRVLALPRNVRSLHVFATRAGQPYTITGFDSIWQRAMRKAVASGIARFHEHDIRAKTATDDPQGAKRRLGHASQSMTDRYVRARTVEKVTPLKRGKP